MKIVFLASANADVRWFTTYYRVVFSEGSREARVRLDRAIDNLAQYPALGHPLTDQIREYSVPRLPFSVIYRIGEDQVEILRLWDQRANREQLEPEQGGSA